MSVIRYWRQEFNLTQNDLANATAVPKWKIQLAEQGVAVLSQIDVEQIAYILNFPANKIADLTNKNLSEQNHGRSK